MHVPHIISKSNNFCNFTRLTPPYPHYRCTKLATLKWEKANTNISLLNKKEMALGVKIQPKIKPKVTELHPSIEPLKRPKIQQTYSYIIDKYLFLL